MRRTEVRPIPSRRAISEWLPRSALCRRMSSAFSEAVRGRPWSEKDERKSGHALRRQPFPKRKAQPDTQKPGLGFPLARIAAVFSLACGAVLDLGICRYAGKGQSELGMLRKLWDMFLPGDVMLADRLMCTWTEMVMLKQRSVECVCRLTSHRTADFRRGKRLEKRYDQFQGNAPNTRSLSASDCPPRREQRLPFARCFTIAARCDRQAPSRRSARQI